MAIFKYKIHCNTENLDKYWFLPDTTSPPKTCPDNTAHVCDLASVAVVKIGDTQEVVTQYEKNDKVLKLASAEATFDVSGLAQISVKIPGNPANGDGRWVAGGYAFMDLWTKGDRILEIHVVDVDGIMGPAGTVLKSYTDDEVDAANKGWRMWQTNSNGGEVEIEPIGGYGFIPAGLYLQISFQRAVGSAATWIGCNIWWGETE